MKTEPITQSTIVTVDPAVLERARRSRDARFDGRFFVGVTSTGIYCRPICPAKTAKAANVEYFASAAAAAEAGLRPCRRCHPEAAPGTPAWQGSSASVTRALRLIDQGALDDDGNVATLASRLGIGERQLRRLFNRHLGASPITVAQTRRLHFALRLLDDTELRLVDVAFASGFSSVRRFNDAFRRAFGRAPSGLRRRRRVARTRAGHAQHFRLSLRPPFAWPKFLDYLRPRAIPGVEQVTATAYRRTFRWRAMSGWFAVESLDETHLDLAVHFDTLPDPLPSLLPLIERVRAVFDLDADPAFFAEQWSRDPILGPLLAENPGIRVPGAWDAFELAVRAILGQQVTVKGATTLAGRLVVAYGDSRADETASEQGLSFHFPRPEALVSAPLEHIGLPGKRADALRCMAAAVAEGRVEFDSEVALDEAVARLVALPGIGEWTAHYVALRALRMPDAFPSGDIGLRREATTVDSLLSTRELEDLAEAWRPWRGYAAMLLWQGAG